MTGSRFGRVGFQFAGFSFPGTPDGDLFDRVCEIARTAERSGFEAVWLMDHLHQIETVGERDEPILEAYTTLAGLAGVTTSARLGVLVTAAGFRNPGLLAKMVTTIDVMSRGRAVLGLGAGWHQEEYTAYGLPFPALGTRMRQLAESVQICRAMFTQPVASFAGQHARLDEARNLPQPLSVSGPPILVGGSGEKTLIPLVARLADGCNFFGGPATVRHKIAVLTRACEAIGRDPATVTKTWLGTVLVVDSEVERRRGLERLGRLFGIRPEAVRGLVLCGSPDEISEQTARYRDAGVDGVIVNLDDAHDLDRLARAGAALCAVMT